MITSSNLAPRLGLVLIFFLSLLSFTLPAQTLGKIDSSNTRTLRIDPGSARGAAVSQIFDRVNFIPLETTKESLFGTIYDLQLVKNQFVIFDYDTKAVLIFGKDGKFKGKIDASKIPKDENDKGKVDFYGYKIVEDNKDSLIAIYSSKYFYYFDLAGKQIKKVLHKNAGFYNDYKLGGEKSVRPRYEKGVGKDTSYYEFAVLNKTDTICYLPYAKNRYQTDQFWDSPKFYDHGAGNELFFLKIHAYDVFSIKPDKVSLAYKIIFPASNSLPGDFMTNSVYVKKRGEYFQKNQKVFFSMNNLYKVDDCLYLQMRSYSWDKETKRSLIYNLKTSEITSLQDLEPDSLSSFLPVTDAGAYHDFDYRGFLLYKDGLFYTSYSSLAMFAFKEQLGDKHKDFPPQLQQYFKTQNRKSNPVIIELKPKKQ